MKAAVILFAGTRDLLKQAGDINAVLAHAGPCLSTVELWVMYHGQQPCTIPEFSCTVSKCVFLAVPPPHLPESLLYVLEQMYASALVDLIVFPGNGLGEELATRLAFRLGGSACSRVDQCRISDDRVIVSKPAYANNLTATIALDKKPGCLSVATTGCDPVRHMDAGRLCVESLTFEPLPCPWVKKISGLPDKPDRGLDDARIVLAIGQGVKEKGNMTIIADIAIAIGARVGASRPVVMNAWADMNQLIGVSGLILSPEICIAAGVSGSGGFSAGIKNSQLVVAINTDSRAPIFKIADIGIVDDLFAVLSALKKIILLEKKTPEHRHTDKTRQPIESGE